MENLTLPLDLNMIGDLDLNNIKIDMSDLKFDCPNDRKLRSAFIFIRNLDIDLNLDFSKCSYQMKEDFIWTYIKGDIHVNIPSLINTWMDILLFKYIKLEEITGILSSEEIKQFYDNNEEIIEEMYTLIASLTVLCVYQYSQNNKLVTDMITFDDQFEESDYDEINFDNFSLLTSSKYFGILFQFVTYRTPKFYNKYFKMDGSAAYVRINESLPIMNLMNIFFAPKEIQDNFINELPKIL